MHAPFLFRITFLVLHPFDAIPNTRSITVNCLSGFG